MCMNLKTYFNFFLIRSFMFFSFSFTQMRSLFFRARCAVVMLLCVCMFFVLIKKWGSEEWIPWALAGSRFENPPMLTFTNCYVYLLTLNCCTAAVDSVMNFLVQSKNPSDWDWDALKPHFKLKIPSHSRFLHSSRWWTAMNMMKDETPGSWIFVSTPTHNTVHSWSSTTRHRTTSSVMSSAVCSRQ